MSALPLADRLELCVFFTMTLALGIAFGWFFAESRRRIRYHQRKVEEARARLREIDAERKDLN